MGKGRYHYINNINKAKHFKSMIWQETPVQQTDSGGYGPQLRYSSGVKVDNSRGIWERILGSRWKGLLLQSRASDWGCGWLN